MSIDQLFTDEHLPGSVRITAAAEIPKQGSAESFSSIVESTTRDSVGEIAETATMSDQTDYRHDLQLRDEQLRREIDFRQESARAEQALRDKAWDDRYAGFLAAQAERDRRLDDSIEGIRGELSKLGSLKANIWGAMATAIGIILAVAALSLTFYQTGKGDSTPAAASAPAQQQTQKQ